MELPQISPEQKLFRDITSRLTHDMLQDVFSIASVEDSAIDLHMELETASKSIEFVNTIIQGNAPIDQDFLGMRQTRRILNDAKGKNGRKTVLFDPFHSEVKPVKLSRQLLKVIDVANNETGTVYKEPANIKDGDPISVFRWYFYDAIARMAAIELGIPNDDKQQELAGDWIASALAEAVVLLAELDDVHAQSVVENMLEIGFISADWCIEGDLPANSPELVKRAQRVTFQGSSITSR